MKNRGLFFTKLYSIATVCTVFALWISVYFSESVEDTLGFILILSVGILHGANDIKLVTNVFENRKKMSFSTILFRYILVVLLTGLSFFLIPSIALIVFVLLSAFHFGEQHLANKSIKANIIFKFIFTFYGLMIFGLLFYLNPTETSNIIYNLTGFWLDKLIYKYILISSFTFLLIFSVYVWIKREMSLNIGEELFLIALFVIIFKLASLVWAFSIYFIFWHSLPSLKDQINVLYGTFNKESIRNYIKSSILYWIFAIIGLGLILYFFRYDQGLFLSLFFAFLAAITIPHVFVMHRIMDQT